jgi:hypothetical protein
MQDELRKRCELYPNDCVFPGDPRYPKTIFDQPIDDYEGPAAPTEIYQFGQMPALPKDVTSRPPVFRCDAQGCYYVGPIGERINLPSPILRAGKALIPILRRVAREVAGRYESRDGRIGDPPLNRPDYPLVKLPKRPPPQPQRAPWPILPTNPDPKPTDPLPETAPERRTLPAPTVETAPERAPQRAPQEIPAPQTAPQPAPQTAPRPASAPFPRPTSSTRPASSTWPGRAPARAPFPSSVPSWVGDFAPLFAFTPSTGRSIRPRFNQDTGTAPQPLTSLQQQGVGFAQSRSSECPPCEPRGPRKKSRKRKECTGSRYRDKKTGQFTSKD